jgi:hypothetical protein
VGKGQTNNFPSSALILADTIDRRALDAHCNKSRALGWMSASQRAMDAVFDVNITVN